MSAGLEFTPGVARAEHHAVAELRRELDEAVVSMRDAVAGERRAHDGLASRVASLDEHLSARVASLESAVKRAVERLDSVHAMLVAEGRTTARGAAVGGVGGSAAVAGAVALLRWLTGT